MALQGIGGYTQWPSNLYFTRDLSFLTLDAAGEILAAIFQVPESKTITHICFRTSAVAISATLRVGLETTNNDGTPTGTQYGGSSPGTLASPASGTWYEVPLSVSASATRPDWVAAVFQFDSTAGDVDISCATGQYHYGCGVPFSLHYDTTAWAQYDRTVVMALKCSDGTYIVPPRYTPMSSALFAGFSLDSSPDEGGLRIYSPAPMRVEGWWFYGRETTTSHEFDVNLYDSSSVSLRSASVGNRAGSTANYEMVFYFGLFDSSYDIQANTEYFLAVKGTVNTYKTPLHVLTFPNASIMSKMPGAGNLYYVYRTDGGAWTADTLSLPRMGLLVSALDDGAGGGGGGGSSVIMGD